MDTLPNELTEKIFLQLHHNHIHSFLQVNYLFNNIFNLHKKNLAKKYLTDFIKENEKNFTKNVIFFETIDKCKNCMTDSNFRNNKYNYASLIIHENSLILSESECKQCYKKNYFIIVFNSYVNSKINYILFDDITKNIRARIKKECRRTIFDKLVSILHVFVDT